MFFSSKKPYEESIKCPINSKWKAKIYETFRVKTVVDTCILHSPRPPSNCENLIQIDGQPFENIDTDRHITLCT